MFQLLRFKFNDNIELDVDVYEFGECGIGELLDRLALKHGGIACFWPRTTATESDSKSR